MTITTVTNAQSIGTGANVGNEKFPTKTQLQATTTSAQVEVRIVNGQAMYDERQDLTIRYAFSAVSAGTAALGAEMARQSSRFIQIAPGPGPLADRVKMSLLEPAPGGGYCYIWCEVPNTVVASALSIYLIEYP